MSGFFGCGAIPEIVEPQRIATYLSKDTFKTTEKTVPSWVAKANDWRKEVTKADLYNIFKEVVKTAAWITVITPVATTLYDTAVYGYNKCKYSEKPFYKTPAFQASCVSVAVAGLAATAYYFCAPQENSYMDYLPSMPKW